MFLDQIYKWNPKTFSFFKKGKTILIGHRGAPNLAHENTLESFNKAFKANLKGIELDIQLSKDNKLIIFHDWKIKKQNGKFQKITSLNYSKILLISEYYNFNIPLLEDVVNMLPKNKFINIELKTMKIFNKKLILLLLKLLIHNKIIDRVIISSFNPFIIYKIKKINSNIFTALIWTNDNSPLLINTPLWVWFCKPDGFHIDNNFLNKKFTTWIKNKNMSLLSYTINTKKDYLLSEIMGLDGVFIDDPYLISNK